MKKRQPIKLGLKERINKVFPFGREFSSEIPRKPAEQITSLLSAQTSNKPARKLSLEKNLKAIQARLIRKYLGRMGIKLKFVKTDSFSLQKFTEKHAIAKKVLEAAKKDILEERASVDAELTLLQNKIQQIKKEGQFEKYSAEYKAQRNLSIKLNSKANDLLLKKIRLSMKLFLLENDFKAAEECSKMIKNSLSFRDSLKTFEKDK